MKHDRDLFEGVIDWVGRPARSDGYYRCVAYMELLAAEGIPAGAVGPNESPRLWERHVLDSLCFAGPAVGRKWLDVGSGAGLPGLPCALVYDINVTVLDRSGRRTDLVRRWVRTLDVDNVDVVTADIARFTEPHDTLLFRGSLGVDRAIDTVAQLGQVGVFGLSHQGTAVPPDDDRTEIVAVPDAVLDSGVTLLRIAV